MQRNDIAPRFLEERLDAICEGMKEGVRREVQRLREAGLPVYVERDGKVLALPPAPPVPAKPA